MLTYISVFNHRRQQVRAEAAGSRVRKGMEAFRPPRMSNDLDKIRRKSPLPDDTGEGAAVKHGFFSSLSSRQRAFITLRLKNAGEPVSPAKNL